MSGLRRVAVLLQRLALSSLAMYAAYLVSTLVWAGASVAGLVGAAGAAGLSLVLVSAINALVLCFPALLSSWRGLRLVGALFVVQFGVETVMTQIETLFFNHALQLPLEGIARIVIAGALRALVFAPLAVLILGRMRVPSARGPSARGPSARSRIAAVSPAAWAARFAAMAAFYVVVYFIFGYFVAWQWPDTRQFYSGTTAILPFFTHMRGYAQASPQVIPFQLLRGALWTGLAALIVRMAGRRRWQACLAAALVFAGLMTSGLALLAVPAMPPAVVRSHTWELLTSMLLFGGTAGRVMFVGLGPRAARPATGDDVLLRQELAMEGAAVRVKEFRKVYGSHVAVENVSFDVAPGEILGLLGPNGAGKTSTLECLEGLRQPDGGSLSVGGIDPSTDSRRLRNIIGVQLQSAGLPESITPQEAMRLFCAYHDVPPRLDLLERLGLSDKRDAQFYTLSAGQQRRLALALAVAHRPSVLFLDEPTAGLDVASRVELHSLMRDLKAAGTTIILATHDMAEAEEMSDRVAILLEGRIAAIGTPLEITAAGGGLTKVSVRTQTGSLAAPDVALPGVSHRLVRDDYGVFFTTAVGPTLSAIIALVEAQGDTLVDLRVERPSLEDRFLEITRPGEAR